MKPNPGFPAKLFVPPPDWIPPVERPPPEASGWRHRLHTIIFEADTPGGRRFDTALFLIILLSVLAVSLESIGEMRLRYGQKLRVLEWVITGLFTVEFLLRLLAVRRPWRYVLSFYGLVDLIAILPTYLSLFFAGAQSLQVVRALRLLRVFRVFKLTQFVGEAALLQAAMRASARKITIFLGAVVTIVLIVGTLMYLIEGEEAGFTSIPVSVYWAIVTMTTVGYGDITPESPLGQVIASMLMIAGYGIIAVPTGIVTIELAEAQRKSRNTQACPACGRGNHADDASFCKYCGEKL
jgi:voltage-gated potassium channel